MADYRVYLLLNEESRRYIGLSESPQVRLQKHNAGLSNWTKNKGPWKLVWQSQSLSLSEARKLETKLKKQKGGRGLDHIIGTLDS